MYQRFRARITQYQKANIIVITPLTEIYSFKEYCDYYYYYFSILNYIRLYFKGTGENTNAFMQSSRQIQHQYFKTP